MKKPTTNTNPLLLPLKNLLAAAVPLQQVQGFESDTLNKAVADAKAAITKELNPTNNHVRKPRKKV